RRPGSRQPVGRPCHATPSTRHAQATGLRPEATLRELLAETLGLTRQGLAKKLKRLGITS
ncbi:MAG: hypothetical protein KAI47_18290, partial [Deltaproteobacteria bacterium]|nr:hypothetical protein [Deltaproteobacteria bacterium]